MCDETNNPPSVVDSNQLNVNLVVKFVGSITAINVIFTAKSGTQSVSSSVVNSGSISSGSSSSRPSSASSASFNSGRGSSY